MAASTAVRIATEAYGTPKTVGVARPNAAGAHPEASSSLALVGASDERRHPPGPNEARDSLVAALIGHSAELLRFARKYAANAADTEDALQELCVKLLVQRYTLRDPAKASGWLKVALRNIAIDHHRKRLAERRAEDVFGETIAANADEGGQPGFAACNCLESALAKLEPNHADMIGRVDIRQESRAHVASSAGISDGNMRIRLLRARRALRRQIDDECPSCPAYDGRQCLCR